MARVIAYCWASGEIELELADDCNLPDGVISFAEGDEDEIWKRVCLNGSFTSEPGLVCVPGLAEWKESSATDPVEILDAWVESVFGDWPLVDRRHTQPEAV